MNEFYKAIVIRINLIYKKMIAENATHETIVKMLVNNAAINAIKYKFNIIEMNQLIDFIVNHCNGLRSQMK